MGERSASQPLGRLNPYHADPYSLLPPPSLAEPSLHRGPRARAGEMRKRPASGASQGYSWGMIHSSQTQLAPGLRPAWLPRPPAHWAAEAWRQGWDQLLFKKGNFIYTPMPGALPLLEISSVLLIYDLPRVASRHRRLRPSPTALPAPFRLPAAETHSI